MSTRKRCKSSPDKASNIVDRVEAEGRGRTPEEDRQIAGYLAELKELRDQEDALGNTIAGIEGNGASQRAGDGSGQFFGSDAGAAFVQSEGSSAEISTRCAKARASQTSSSTRSSGTWPLTSYTCACSSRRR